MSQSEFNFNIYKETVKRIAPLTDADCDMFIPHLKIKQYAKGTHFVAEGQISNEIGFISKGAFRIYYLVDGKEVNGNFFFENEFVVEYQSFLLQCPSKYYIQTMEDSEVITFTSAQLHNNYNLSQNWERFGRIIAEKLFIDATERTESFLFLTGEQRYLNLLKRRPKIFERVPLYQIASHLGIERESRSRLRKKILKG
jgi:CRP/FNR family transcriptional regulator